MPPLDLDMNVYSRHFTDQSSVMGCGDLIQSVLAPPQQITGGAEHHATSSYMAPVQEQDRQLVLDLAATAADTLAKMCRAGEPLWLRRRGTCSEVMVADEYARMFSWPVDRGQHDSASTGAAARTEGSRDSTVVIMNSITLVDAFLDAVSFRSSILMPKHFGKIMVSTFGGLVACRQCGKIMARTRRKVGHKMAAVGRSVGGGWCEATIAPPTGVA